jgi:hypothetical protein
MRYGITILIWLLSFSVFAFETHTPKSSGAAVTGVVKDAASGETLAGVRVQIKGTEMVTYSDKQGHFVFDQIPSGDFQVTFQLVSFETEELILSDISKAGTELEIALTEK